MQITHSRPREVVTKNNNTGGLERTRVFTQVKEEEESSRSERQRCMGQELRIYREFEKLKEFLVRLELKG